MLAFGISPQAEQNFKKFSAFRLSKKQLVQCRIVEKCFPNMLVFNKYYASVRHTRLQFGRIVKIFFENWFIALPRVPMANIRCSLVGHCHGQSIKVIFTLLQFSIADVWYLIVGRSRFNIDRAPMEITGTWRRRKKRKMNTAQHKSTERQLNNIKWKI